MSGYRVGYMIGSLSTESINRTLAKTLIRLAPRDLRSIGRKRRLVQSSIAISIYGGEMQYLDLRNGGRELNLN
jgi:hypothetical protein